MINLTSDVHFLIGIKIIIRKQINENKAHYLEVVIRNTDIISSIKIP